VKPRKHGGTDDEENLVTSCGYCNAIKGDRDFNSLEEARVYIQNRRQELEHTFLKIKAAVRGAQGKWP